MFNWDDFRYFLAVTECGTQKAAARKLKTDQATVGRRIKQLESELRAKLFDKTSDGYVLTAVGQRVFELARNIDNQFSEIDRKVSGIDESPTGIVKIASAGGLINHWLVPNLKEFHDKYPQIALEFLTGPEVVNLWKREADIAIRFVKPTQRELSFKKLGEVELNFYATRKFVAAHSAVIQKGQLATLPFIGLFQNATSVAEEGLLAKAGLEQRPICRSHAWAAVYAAIQADLGFGVLPSFYATKENGLTVLPNTPTTNAAVWFVTHPDLKKSVKVKAFGEYCEALAKRTFVR